VSIKNSGKPASTTNSSSPVQPQPPSISLRMLRLRALAEKSGYSGTTIYRRIAVGLWTTPVRLGPQRSVWPEHEADALLGARVAGGNDDEIRQLVVRLHAERGAQQQELQEPHERSKKMRRLAARSVAKRSSRRT
jgi:prophage regulatory protein